MRLLTRPVPNRQICPPCAQERFPLGTCDLHARNVLPNYAFMRVRRQNRSPCARTPCAMGAFAQDSPHPLAQLESAERISSAHGLRFCPSRAHGGHIWRSMRMGMHFGRTPARMKAIFDTGRARKSFLASPRRASKKAPSYAAYRHSRPLPAALVHI